MRQPALVLAIVILCLATAPARALPDLSGEPIQGFAGYVAGTLDVGPTRPIGTPVPTAVSVAYDNTASGSNFGLSSTDLAAEWGDRIYLTGGGLLASHTFTIFNSAASSGGPLLTATIGIAFTDAVTETFIGGYEVNVDFGLGLPTGYYAQVTVPALEVKSIVLTPDVLVTQTVISYTGSANRLGIASLTPITVGSSPPTMHIFAGTIGGGVAGYYTVGNGPADPGYQVGLAQQPDGTLMRTWGQLKRLYK